MLRQCIAIFFLLAFSAQLFNRTVMMLGYYVNTAAFAKNCENKARPALHCNGKCQLIKKIKQEEKKEQQNPGRKLEYKNEVISSKSFFCNLSFGSDLDVTPTTFYYNPFIPSGIYTRVFHPPGLV